MTQKIYSVSKLHRLFKNYNKDMNDIWESFSLVDFYMPRIHAYLKKGKIASFQLINLAGKNKKLKKDDTYGAISHLLRKANPRRALVDAVSQFEHYLGLMTTIVYEDYPGKLYGNGTINSGESRDKMIKTIIESFDKNEIIQKIVEEKVRGIFYGNPIDLFIKDKAKLEFGSYFTEYYARPLADFAEIVARRNILIHNNGKVDRKYLREVNDSSFKIGQKVSLSGEYLRRAICVLSGLSAVASSLVVKKIYKKMPQGRIAFVTKSFAQQQKLLYPDV